MNEMGRSCDANFLFCILFISLWKSELCYRSIIVSDVQYKNSFAAPRTPDTALVGQPGLVEVCTARSTLSILFFIFLIQMKSSIHSYQNWFSLIINNWNILLGCGLIGAQSNIQWR